MFLLSNDISLNLEPRTGSNTHPFPLPPVNEIFVIAFISNSCGSTNIFSTLPESIGSTKAVVPELASTVTTGGFIISYLSPPFNTSIFSIGP